MVVVALMIATGAVGAWAIEPVLPDNWQDWIDARQGDISGTSSVGSEPTFPLRIAPTGPVVPDADEQGELPSEQKLREEAAELEVGSSLTSTVEKEIHLLVNEERTTPLLWDEELAAIARRHSVDQAAKGYFSHKNSLGQSPTERGLQAGYECFKDYGSYYTEGLAENIFSLAGYAWEDVAQVTVEGWMDSPGHRANILHESYSKEGIGVAEGEFGDIYVTQNFC